MARGSRRWSGEARLVFGLAVDDGGQPYPMTFILETRLPALQEQALLDGGVLYQADGTFVPLTGLTNDAEWIAGRRRWARVWSDLSATSVTDPSYHGKLLKVVRLFATADDFLSMRSGEQEYDLDAGRLTNEFEYREFYVNGSYTLTTRKLRREPFRCADSSNALASRITAEWYDAGGNFHFTAMLGDRAMEDSEVAELDDTCTGLLRDAGDPNWDVEHLPYGQALDSCSATRAPARRPGTRMASPCPIRR